MSYPELNPGAAITIQPVEHSIYSKVYQSKVLEIQGNELMVSIPDHNGQMIPLPAGARVHININGKTYETKILSRKFGTNKMLILALPNALYHNVDGDVDTELPNKTRVLAITSGKGGVGKSSIAINLAIYLSKMDQRVCLVDADLGMANIDILLKMTPKLNLTHLLSQDVDIFDVILEGPEKIMVIPGGSGWQQIHNLRTPQFNRLVNAFKKLEHYTDMIIFDTGAGINQNIINFLLASDEVLLVTTPEPHAITDAYAMIKIVSEQNSELPIKLIVNRVANGSEGKDVGDKITFAAKQFLNVSVEYIGHVREDQVFQKATRSQTPLSIGWPRNTTAKNLQNLARALHGQENPKSAKGLIGFLKKLTGF